MKRKNLDRWKLLHRSVGDFLPQPATCVCERERESEHVRGTCVKRGEEEDKGGPPSLPLPLPLTIAAVCTCHDTDTVTTIKQEGGETLSLVIYASLYISITPPSSRETGVFSLSQSMLKNCCRIKQRCCLMRKKSQV